MMTARSTILVCLLCCTDQISHAQATWTATGSTAAPHEQLQGTLLPNGKVLLVGTLACEPGCYSGTAAELYDPAKGAWSTTSSPLYPRFNHIAELLPSGQVLVASGYISPGYLTATAEIYDPSAQTWSRTGSLATGRQFHLSARLKDGRVLIAGGLGMNGKGSFQALDSAEIYDPSTGTWASAGSMSTPRWAHAVTTLRDGRVLVAGGSNSTMGSAPSLGTAEIYDPASNTWSPAASLNAGRQAHRAVLLPNGQVMVTGGVGAGGCLAGTELYDPMADRWTTSAPMSAGRSGFSLTLLPNGRVLAAGGSGGNGCAAALDTAEVYDPDLQTWSPAGNLVQARWSSASALLPDGKVLLAGGEDPATQASGQSGLTSAELFGTAPAGNGVAVSVSSASYRDNDSLAPESLASVFGSGFTSSAVSAQTTPLPSTLGGLSVSVEDSAGVTRDAPLLAVSSGQINYQVPAGTSPGPASLSVLQNGVPVASGKVSIAPVAPGLFGAAGTGAGPAAAIVQRIRSDGTQSFEPVATFDSTANQFVPVPIDLSSPADQVFLLLFGTGLRFHSSTAVTASIGATSVNAAYAGPAPQFAGLDQLNVLLPSQLAGSGTVPVTVTVDGLLSNTVQIAIR